MRHNLQYKLYTSFVHCKNLSTGLCDTLLNFCWKESLARTYSTMSPMQTILNTIVLADCSLHHTDPIAITHQHPRPAALLLHPWLVQPPMRPLPQPPRQEISNSALNEKKRKSKKERKKVGAGISNTLSNEFSPVMTEHFWCKGLMQKIAPRDPNELLKEAELLRPLRCP